MTKEDDAAPRRICREQLRTYGTRLYDMPGWKTMNSREERFAKVTELFQTLHRIRFSEILESDNNGPGMCMPEFSIALCINKMEEEGCEQVLVADLVKKLPSSPQAISKYLKQLEDRGLIERVSVRSDRRSTELMLTDKGREAFECSRKRMDMFFREVFAEVGDEEFDRMIGFLNRICESMMKRSQQAHENCRREINAPA